ncbi:protein ripply1-like [Stegostoma tigrinum]|uniref:protein ripply1-like n=1 Tax=Stegostoma tigrinum TaxID=3053191 RepID=UPI00202B06F2|nr:protein ripply1-like [Stegostoma tigrinum]
MTARDIDSQRWGRHNLPSHMGRINHEIASQATSLFTHPVRLMWPRSKCYDHLYSEGQKLLAAFPVQATISFYVESDTDDEDEEFNEEDELEASAIEETTLGKITEQKIQQS